MKLLKANNTVGLFYLNYYLQFSNPCVLLNVLHYIEMVDITYMKLYPRVIWFYYRRSTTSNPTVALFVSTAMERLEFAPLLDNAQATLSGIFHMQLVALPQPIPSNLVRSCWCWCDPKWWSGSRFRTINRRNVGAALAVAANDETPNLLTVGFLKSHRLVQFTNLPYKCFMALCLLHQQNKWCPTY